MKLFEYGEAVLWNSLSFFYDVNDCKKRHRNIHSSVFSGSFCYLNSGTDPVIAARAMKITKIPRAHFADSFCHSPISRPVRFRSR